MFPSLASAKAAVIVVAEEIATLRIAIRIMSFCLYIHRIRKCLRRKGFSCVHQIMCDELGIGNETESEHLLNDQPEVGNEEQRKTPNQAIRRATALTCRMKEDFVGKPLWILG
ncbi:hypothetical protein IFM89_026424 [Coptis chinensis]|uniref:Uncharacterized protein n=1 Tax=Coptis chinensis TaxID=261450 RepID=A0A835HQ66_9MAGN|nr:hypothetical protein IFM89_026424 [Coptis chinensis]